MGWVALAVLTLAVVFVFIVFMPTKWLERDAISDYYEREHRRQMRKLKGGE